MNNSKANILNIKHILPKHSRIASLEGSKRENNISTEALMVGLRSNLSALRGRLEEKLEISFEREICGSEDCSGISFGSLNSRLKLSGDRVDKVSRWRRLLSNCR